MAHGTILCREYYRLAVYGIVIKVSFFLQLNLTPYLIWEFFSSHISEPVLSQHKILSLH